METELAYGQSAPFSLRRAILLFPMPFANVRYWHLASFAALHHFWSLLDKSGHWPELALNGSVANDP